VGAGEEEEVGGRERKGVGHRSADGRIGRARSRQARQMPPPRPPQIWPWRARAPRRYPADPAPYSQPRRAHARRVSSARQCALLQRRQRREEDGRADVARAPAAEIVPKRKADAHTWPRAAPRAPPISGAPCPAPPPVRACPRTATCVPNRDSGRSARFLARSCVACRESSRRESRRRRAECRIAINARVSPRVDCTLQRCRRHGIRVGIDKLPRAPRDADASITTASPRRCSLRQIKWLAHATSRARSSMGRHLTALTTHVHAGEAP
jgi:hypothetical protein